MASFTMSRIDRVYRSYSVVATLPDGTTVQPAAVDFALIPTDTTSPGTGTTWTAGELADGRWRVVLAGPDASSTGAIAVPAWGGDLWMRVTDISEVIAVKVDRITVT